MGFDNDKYPLPAPTESSTLDSADESIHIDDIDTNVSTNVSNRTDRTSYSVPDDGTPITINTTTPTKPHGSGTLHKKFTSQTSLLIEYFDTGSTDGQDQRRASVRVRITPSSRKSKKSSANDHIQISQASRNHPLFFPISRPSRPRTPRFCPASPTTTTATAAASFPFPRTFPLCPQTA